MKNLQPLSQELEEIESSSSENVSNIAIESLQSLSSNKLRERFKLPPYLYPVLKAALNHFYVLSDNSLTNSQMARKLGVVSPTLSQYRHALIKSGLIKPKIVSHRRASFKPFQKSEQYDEIRNFSKKYGIGYTYANNLWHALKHFDVLSDDRLSIEDMAKKIDILPTAAQLYRTALIKAKLVKPRRKRLEVDEQTKKEIIELRKKGYSSTQIGKKVDVPWHVALRYSDHSNPSLKNVRHVKKLTIVRHGRERLVPISNSELKNTNVDPEKEWYGLVKPAFHEFTIEIYEERKLDKPKSSIELTMIFKEHGVREVSAEKVFEYFDVLTDYDSTHAEIAKKSGLKQTAVNHYRHALIKSGIIKPYKKLALTSGTGRMIGASGSELLEMGLDPTKEYYGYVQPDYHKLRIKVFPSKEEACRYAIGEQPTQLSSIMLEILKGG